MIARILQVLGVAALGVGGALVHAGLIPLAVAAILLGAALIVSPLPDHRTTP